ncbi:hypothetical protein G9A89_020793 [Geosiphon pyriformis]|nr:hypothetical protein G9A89_020793 [Geosiphon pyriformis]
MEFVSQSSLNAVFLVELTNSIHLVTLKIAKFLVVSEFGSLSAVVVLYDVPLSVSAIDIKTALGVFGGVSYVVMKPAGIWQYVMVHFESLDAATSALNYWSVLLLLSIVKPVGSLVKLFEQFINSNLVLNSKLGLKINEIMVHMGSFSKVVGKLEKKVVLLKKKCCMEDIDMSGNSEHSVDLDDEVFSNLISL